MPRRSSIQEEIKQSRPFESVRQEAVVALLRTASIVRRQIDAMTAQHGITGQQYNVLRILRGAGGPMPTMEVAERMIDPEPGITRMFGRLEAKGLVLRARCSDDGRRMLCSITPKGLEALAMFDRTMVDLDTEVFEGLTDDQIRELLALLDLVRNPSDASD